VKQDQSEEMAYQYGNTKNRAYGYQAPKNAPGSMTLKVTNMTTSLMEHEGSPQTHQRAGTFNTLSPGVGVSHQGTSPRSAYSPRMGGEGGGLTKVDEDLIKLLTILTKEIHTTCDCLSKGLTTLWNRKGAGCTEGELRTFVTAAKRATTASQQLVERLQPHRGSTKLAAVVESYLTLGGSVVRFVRHSSAILIKDQGQFTPIQYGHGRELYDNTRNQMKKALESLKLLQKHQMAHVQTGSMYSPHSSNTGPGLQEPAGQVQRSVSPAPPPALFTADSSTNLQPANPLAEFVSLCKACMSLMTDLTSIAYHKDPSMLTEEAESRFVSLAGTFVKNSKLIIDFCVSNEYDTVDTAEFRDQATRVVVSAKLLFRTRSSYASELFIADRDAMVANLKELVGEVSRLRGQRSFSAEAVVQGGASPSPATEGGGSGTKRPPHFLKNHSFNERRSVLKDMTVNLRPKKGASDIEKQRALEEEKKAYKPHMRCQLVQEFVSTERTYVTNLGIVKTVYMMKMVNVKWLTKEEYNLLFANLQDIVNINSSLLNDMQGKVREVNDKAEDAMMGALFKANAEGFVQYAKYVNNFDDSLKVLEELQSRKDAKKFFDGILETHQGQLLDLGAYLIMPVQRLPRYELLLRELRKFTPSFHPDSEAIDEALAKMKVVNAKINEMKRDEETKQKWLKIKESLTADKVHSPATNELLPGFNKVHVLFRETVVETSVSKSHKLHKGSKIDKLLRKVKMTIFVFDDMILFTEKKGKKFNIKYYVIYDEHCSVRGETDLIVLQHEDIILGYRYTFQMHASGDLWKQLMRDVRTGIRTAQSSTTAT